MCCTNRLLWHTNSDFYGIRNPPPFHAVWTVFIGGGGGLSFVCVLPCWRIYFLCSWLSAWLSARFTDWLLPFSSRSSAWISRMNFRRSFLLPWILPIYVKLIAWAELKRGGGERTGKRNLARMARRKPFFESLRKQFQKGSAEGNSGNF